MNVTELVGAGPDIWQFFVAVVALNVVILGGLAIANWVHIARTHKKKLSLKQAIDVALGRSKQHH